MNRRDLFKLGDIIENLDNKRKPLNSEVRARMKSNPVYPYYGANGLLDYIESYIFDEEILCIAEDGGSWGYKQTCAYIVAGKSWVNNHAHVIKCPEDVEIRYLKHYLNYTDLTSYITGTTRGKLTKTALNSIPIPLPPLPIQRKIADALDKAQALIDKRKKQIELLDEYIKSVFLDMFGNPVTNPMGWDKFAFSEFSDSRLGKMYDVKKVTGKYLENYLGNSNVRWFGFELDDLNQMDFDDNEKQKYSLKNGDLLICEGGEIGRCAIWRDELVNCYFQKAIHRVRVNLELIIPDYLQYVMLFYSINGGFKDYSSMATIAHLTGAKLKKMTVPIPPKELQNRFADIVQKTEQQKQKMQESLAKLEENYQSISQRAFTGELFV